MKPEFFCCIGGELKDTIQGIFKCSRVFIYRAAENQTIDDMLVDGFFNEADDIRVNDLIILYCPEQTRAYTFAKVSSIIGGIVKTKELDTPNLPANVSAFFNDVGYLTASDLATVALTGNLSDLNDTTITNPATGEYLRWNGAKWINMAGGGGGSAVWGSVGGNIADQADLQIELSSKANVDLDNLTDTGANIANWSSNVTNCITEIPQDIKLELNAGVLTLKAGSKVYVPNGLDGGNNPIFDTINIVNDVILNGRASDDIICYDFENGILYPSQNGTSGSTTPSSPTWFYNTSTNILQRYNAGSANTGKSSFPICMVKNNGSTYSSIDQVFNGFGYIGSTVFALPGVKGLIPNYRNSDGTVKNIDASLTNVTILDVSDRANYNDVLVLYDDLTLGRTAINDYLVAERKPTISPTNHVFWFDVDTNIVEEYRLGVETGKLSALLGTYTVDANGKITSLSPKQVFRAVDYSDIVDDINDESPSKLTTVEWVKNKIMASVLGDLYPVGSIYIGTQGTCPLATLIPGSTWQQIQGRYLLASGTIAGTSEYAATGTYIAAGLPDIWFDFQAHNSYGTSNPAVSGCMTISGASNGVGWNGTSNTRTSYYFRPWMQSSIFAQSTTVRPPAYAVNVWRRTA